MSGYWNSVPRGTWTVTDPSDALDAVKDPESRAVYHYKAKRVYVFGPEKKALIIDMAKIESLLDKAQFDELLEEMVNFGLILPFILCGADGGDHGIDG